MDFQPTPLPYAEDALEPYIGRATLMLHHGKHHLGYLAQLARLIGGTPAASRSLEAIIRQSEGPVFECAAQVWNHDFYWRSMKPEGGGELGGPLAAAIAEDFGGFGAFRNAFLEAGESHFGSGWLWLVHYGGRLRVVTTPDADLPLVYRVPAILTVDLWEHAYYLDYHNERARYVSAFLDHLVDWEFAAANWRNIEPKPSRRSTARVGPTARRRVFG